jgi:NAD+ synthetase
MKFALAQTNPTIGDLENNLNKILKNIDLAAKENVEVIIFPELALSGYPPKDLLLKRQFIEDNKKYLNLLAEKANKQITVILGIIEENYGEGKPLFNSVAVIKENKIVYTRQKTLLPTYDVFDEDRYFESGKTITPAKLFGKNFGLSICEDIWHDDISWARPRYKIDPITELCKTNLDLIINCSASPYFMGKPQLREKVLINCAKKHKLPIIYVNQVGGNDDLIFDGNSCIIDKNGEVILKLKSFEEDLQFFDLDVPHPTISPSPHNPEEELLQAITCGLHDYVNKCGFKKVIIGVSGGIDSALVATLAARALGKENVLGIFMPSRFTSSESEKDAKDLANNLRIELKTFSIEEPFKAFTQLLSPTLSEKGVGIENIQSRIRGSILMSLSNETGSLVLTTGNKSEIATGYCTLYGDMCGALAVISDLSKNNVYNLSKYINKKEGKEIIPENTIRKEPTAELRPNQKDQDTLPPYDVLDKILELYVEDHIPAKEIVNNNIPIETIKKVCNMIDVNEYKRQQAAPGLKLTSRAFGFGWRMPIAKRYKEN